MCSPVVYALEGCFRCVRVCCRHMCTQGFKEKRVRVLHVWRVFNVRVHCVITVRGTRMRKNLTRFSVHTGADVVDDTRCG